MIRLKAFFLSLVLLLTLVVPNFAFAESTKSFKQELSQLEVNTILSKETSLDLELRDATAEEFKKISNKAIEMLKENPNDKVDVNRILKELNLTDIAVKEERDFQVQPMFITVGSVGFSNYERAQLYFLAHPHVRNSIPFTTIDQIAGYVSGYSVVPGSSTYVRQFNDYFSKLNVTYGLTKVLDRKSVSHFGTEAKMEISAVVNDGGKTQTVFNRIVSKVDGTFTN